MQRFNYNEAKLNMSRSNEEAARKKASEEREKEQAKVNEVLYQDSRRISTGGGSSVGSQSSGASSASSQVEPKKNPHDTHAYVKNGDEVDKSVVVTPPSEPEINQSRVHHGNTRFDDDDIEDFKENFDKVESNVSTSVPDDFLDVESIDMNTEQDGMDADEVLRAYEAEEEAERQRKEEALSKKQQQSVKPVKKSGTSSMVKQNVSVKKDTSYLKEFPTDLAMRAKSLFPEATTMNDAVAAYIYLKEGKPADLNVPDRIKSIANTFLGETVSVKDSHDDLSKDLLQLKMHDRVITQKLETLELAIVYSLFDRIGFRKSEQASPATVDFLEPGVVDLFNRLEKQSKMKQMRDANRNGTPIR